MGFNVPIFLSIVNKFHHFIANYDKRTSIIAFGRKIKIVTFLSNLIFRWYPSKMVVKYTVITTLIKYYLQSNNLWIIDRKCCINIFGNIIQPLNIEYFSIMHKQANDIRACSFKSFDFSNLLSFIANSKFKTKSKW